MPLVLDPAPSMPFISSRSLNLAVLIDEGPGAGKLARVKIPSVLPRAVPVGTGGHTFVLLEDLISQHLSYLFPDVPITGNSQYPARKVPAMLPSAPQAPTLPITLPVPGLWRRASRATAGPTSPSANAGGPKTIAT